jgi:electron transport complex protein RnfC
MRQQLPDESDAENIYAYAGKDNIEECEKLGVMDCIECGCCSYECPGRLNLVQTFRAVKDRVRAARAAK